MRELTLLTKMKKRAKELKKQVFALYLAYRKKETPFLAKVFTVIIVAYALSPLDLIPDFIPILGYLDDLILIPAGIALALKLIPDEIIAQCNKEAEETFSKDIPEAKIASAVIVLIWLLLIGMVVVFSLTHFH